MSRFSRRSHHVPSGWMVCVSRNNRLGGRRMVVLCGLCGFTMWDIIVAMLTITVRRCVWGINNEWGYHWFGIYQSVILMRANNLRRMTAWVIPHLVLIQRLKKGGSNSGPLGPKPATFTSITYRPSEMYHVSLQCFVQHSTHCFTGNVVSEINK